MMFASVSSFVGDMCRVSLATQTKRKTPQRTEQRASHERRVTCHDVMRRLCRKKKSSFPCFVVKEEEDSLRLPSFDGRDTTRYIYICVCDTDTHDKCDAVFGSERGVRERCVSAVFNEKEATTKTRLSYVFVIVVDSHHHQKPPLDMLGMKYVCGLSYHVTEIGYNIGLIKYTSVLM